MTDSPTPTPDWLRLQKALSLEAERGFNNLEGKQQRFSEFLQDSLRCPPNQLPGTEQARWTDLAEKFTQYSELSFAQRQHLVADTRRTLYETRRTLESQVEKASAAAANGAAKKPKVESRPRSPKTAEVAASAGATHGRKPDLEQSVTSLKGIGPKNGERLAKLGLLQS